MMENSSLKNKKHFKTFELYCFLTYMATPAHTFKGIFPLLIIESTLRLKARQEDTWPAGQATARATQGSSLGFPIQFQDRGSCSMASELRRMPPTSQRNSSEAPEKPPGSPAPPLSFSSSLSSSRWIGSNSLTISICNRPLCSVPLPFPLATDPLFWWTARVRDSITFLKLMDDASCGRVLDFNLKFGN